MERPRPRGTYLFCSLRPDRAEALRRLSEVLRGLLPAGGAARDSARAEMELFLDVVLPRLASEVTIALAEQEIKLAGGGFPAQFTFFTLKGAEALAPGLERLLASRSLGLFSPGERLPTSYPYLVRRRLEGALVYEIVIRNTRRHEGYRPALAIRGDELVYSSSLAALESFMSGGGEPPEGAPDPRLAPRGEEIVRIEWRRPSRFEPLRNAYDYFVELRRYRDRSASRVLSDETDYDALRRALESVLGELRSHARVGVREEGGLRLRARWDLAD